MIGTSTLPEPTDDGAIVAPEDGVRYEDVVRAMDVAAAAGFANLSMADGAAFL